MGERAEIGPPQPAPSLRRHWMRSFALLLALIVVTGALAVLSLRAVVGDFRAANNELRSETAVIADLRLQVGTLQGLAHTALEDASAGPEFERVVGVANSTFLRAAAAMDAPAELRALRGARAALTRGTAVVHPYGRVPDFVEQDLRHRAAGEEFDRVDARLDEMDRISQVEIEADLRDAGRTEGRTTALILGLFVAAFATVLWCARSLSSDVLRPVVNLRDGTRRLAAGDLAHRLPVEGRGEIGELTTHFNEMAQALATSHTDLKAQAETDPLTGLANRAVLRKRLHTAFAQRERRAARPTVLFIDVDDFKIVNDSRGHDCGDQLLRLFAARVSGSCRPTDLVVRLGGDEFAVLIEAPPDQGTGAVLARRILGALRVPFELDGVETPIGASIGVAHRHQDDADAEELLRHADIAMYLAKSQGKHRFEIYSPSAHEEMIGQRALRADVARAAPNDELFLVYQPVVELETGRIEGVEALLRWDHPSRGIVPPLELIPVAEETGDIVAIGAWVLNEACRQLRTWHEAIPERLDLWVSVNLSVRQLAEPSFVDQVQETLTAAGIKPSALVLEVTESMLIEGYDEVVGVLERLRQLGVGLALDDFGTGFSSLGHLRRLPVDTLKIDRSFVSGPEGGARSAAVLDAVVGLARTLGLGIIPEGIESEAQLRQLGDLGCRLGQGFHTGRPAAAEAITALLGERDAVGSQEHSLAGR